MIDTYENIIALMAIGMCNRVFFFFFFAFALR